MQCKKLGEICAKKSSNIAQKDILDRNGEYPIYGASGFIKNVDFYKREEEYIAIVKDGAGVGRVFCLPAKSSVIGTMQYILPNKSVDIRYLYYVLQKLDLARYNLGAAIPHIYFKDYQNETVALPSIREQRDIVNKLDKLEELISAANLQLAKLDELVKSKFVEMFGNLSSIDNSLRKIKLADLCNVCSSKRIYQNEQSNSGIPFLRVADLVKRIEKDCKDCELYISELRFNELKKQNLVPCIGDILVTSRGTLGKCYIVSDTDNFYFQDGMISWLRSFKADILPEFLVYAFSTQDIIKQINEMQSGSTVAYLSLAMLKKLKITLPSVTRQKEFVAVLHKQRELHQTIKQQLVYLETLKKSLMQEYFG